MNQVRFYVDVHLDLAITRALRQRGVDVLTAQDDRRAELPDDQVLQRSTDLGRVLVTYDDDFWGWAERWRHAGRAFTGVIYIESATMTIGQVIDHLEEIAQAMTADEWINRMDRLPLTY